MAKSSGGIRGAGRGNGITYDNFYEKTVGVYQMLSSRPQGAPSYVSTKFGAPDKVSSEYWYGRDKRGEYVIRGSDHWSMYTSGVNSRSLPNNSYAIKELQSQRLITNIASVYWGINGGIKVPTSKSMSFTDWANRYSTLNAYRDNDGRLYGKIYLKDLQRLDDSAKRAADVYASNGRLKRGIDLFKL